MNSPRKPLRLLLVEDSPDDAELILLQLEENGFDVDCTRVDNAPAMRQALADDRWDMVISDFNLPQFGAREALALLRAACAVTPFIIVSGFIGEENAIALMKEGANDFVMKDKMARLAPAVSRELQDAAARHERKRAERELLESRQQLRELSAHQQMMIEEERMRIARELHDELGQMLTGVKLDAMWLQANLSGDQQSVANKIAAMSRLIDETLNAMHRVATDLRPSLLDNLGLAPSVEWLTEEFATRTGIRITLKKDVGQPRYGCDGHCHKDGCKLADEVSISAYRIVQECLTNVARHAQAKQVRVDLRCRDDELMIRVADDGKGITPDSQNKRKSFGLTGMRERAYGLGGRLTISSAPGKGASVEAILPIKLTDNGKY